MHPLIKWPGGKSSEISKIEPYIPDYKRYVEPFFGGGALFFHLKPQCACINDISSSLIDFYRLIKNQDKQLYNLLLCYSNSFSNLLNVCNRNYGEILNIYNMLELWELPKKDLEYKLTELINSLSEKIDYGFNEEILLDKKEFYARLVRMVSDKMRRTVKNNKKTHFSDEDLKNNLLTGFMSGYYIYFRDVFNDINLERIKSPSAQYTTANFYFIREYCYGSMFRYNATGEFNIPYGGISYNTKNLKSKIDNMFSKEVETIFRNTDIHCSDFEEFFKKLHLSENDFIFLDPPFEYPFKCDTDFSDYDGEDFTQFDHARLLYCLKNTTARFILIIKNTDFIYKIYKNNFNIILADNCYTYNMRNRNKCITEYMLITNLPVKS